MKKVALIAPGYLPIPSFYGGAIESLATKFIEENEKKQKIELHVFSFLPRDCECPKTYKHTVFHYYHSSLFARTYNMLNRAIFKLSHYEIKPKNYLSNKFNRFNKDDIFDSIIVDGNHAQLYSIKPKKKTFMYFHITPNLLPFQKSDSVMNSIGGIIVISDYVKNFLVNNTQIKPSNITTIFNCCETDNFKFSQIKRNEVREELGIDENECVFIYCGRLAEGKGVGDVVEAFSRASLKNSKLLIVGSVWFNSNKDDEFSRRLKQNAKSNPNIIFVGFINHGELNKYYSCADVFVSPSKCNEAAGLVNIEAAANGLKIITSKDGGIPEYVENFNASFVGGEDRVRSLTDFFEFYDKQSTQKMIERIFLKEELDRFSVGNYYDNIINVILRGN